VNSQFKHRLKHRNIRNVISTCDNCHHQVTFGYSVWKPRTVSAETETRYSASHRNRNNIETAISVRFREKKTETETETSSTSNLLVVTQQVVYAQQPVPRTAQVRSISTCQDVVQLAGCPQIHNTSK